MNHQQKHPYFSQFIQKAFLKKNRSLTLSDGKPDTRTIEYKLADQVSRYMPLLELQDRRQLVQVQVAGNCHPYSYQSMILGVDFVKGWLLLDSLTPINPYCPIVLGDTLTVSHRQQGQILCISGGLVDIVSDSEHLIYAMALPKDIAYQQRRFYPRFNLSEPSNHSCPLRLRVRSPIKTPWHCALNNISAGGMRFTVPGKVTQQLRVGTALPEAEIIVNELKIHCPLVIKAFRHQRKPYESTAISAAFTGLTAEERIRLQQVIQFNLASSSSNTADSLS